MKNKSIICLLGLLPMIGFSQIGINTEIPKVTLHIEPSSKTTPKGTDGILIPKIKNFPKENPTVKGMLVFLEGNDTLPNNFYFWDGTKWVAFILDVDKSIDETVYSFNGKGMNNGYLSFSSFNKKRKDNFEIKNNRDIKVGQKGTYLVTISSSIRKQGSGLSNFDYTIGIQRGNLSTSFNESTSYPLQENMTGSSIVFSFIYNFEAGDIINIQGAGTGSYQYTSIGTNNITLTLIRS